MNPQYMAFGGPQAVMQPNKPPAPTQPLPPQSGGFQNVPLGPPRPGAPAVPSGVDPASVFPTRPPMSQLPPSQLPPNPNGSQLGIQNGPPMRSTAEIKPTMPGKPINTVPAMPPSHPPQVFDGNSMQSMEKPGISRDGEHQSTPPAGIMHPPTNAPINNVGNPPHMNQNQNINVPTENITPQMINRPLGMQEPTVMSQMAGQHIGSQMRASGPPTATLQMGNMPNMPPGGMQNVPPSMGMPQVQPLMPGMTHNVPPPQMGQYPGHPDAALMQKRPPMPQMPGYNNINQAGPMMGGPLPGGQQMPPIGAGGPMNQFNQMNNQMQNMNLSGPYPPRPMNGEGMPTMPMQMNQPGGFMNGQQVRPPMPGMPGMPTQQYQQSAYEQQQQQQRRLNPDQMPSPIQVLQDDQAHRAGIFYTNQKGLVPPLVSTKFVVQDQGYASPRFLRSTMYNVPITNELIKQTAVPFGLVISPMARTVEGEYAPPIVNFGELGPVRCVRCKAYMCPYMQFIDSGRRFQCLFCKAATDVPAEYFQHLDHSGQRMDRYERPELVLGTYEFTATKDYCRNNTFPKPPALIFLIDVSYNNVKSGLVALLCSQMKDIIKNMPIDEGHTTSNMKVGFITYNSSVHFYNIKGNLAAPQMLVVGDTQEMFMPLLDGFLCTPEESEDVIDALMEQIPQMFADTRECETVLLPAIVAGMEALKASDCTGKLLVFHSSLPIAEAPGKLKARDDRKLLGTEKERTVLTPQNQIYSQLGQDCVGVGCSVDLFLFNNAYIDIATIGQVARLSGGEVYKYTYFQADLDGDRVIHDLVMNISRPIAFDSIMRVRTSTGVRPTDFYGHCFMSNTTDIELASIDCDKALAIEVKHDDKLQEDEGIYIQVALLYTSVSGQRRLRIINQALKTCSQMADLYRSCDLETMLNFMSKQATYKLLDNNPKAVKDGIVARAAQILANYRKNCASPSSAGQLILPECMKLLPLYVNCLIRSDALSGGSDMTIDDRSFAMMAVMTMDIPNTVNYFYPQLIPLHEIDEKDELRTMPMQIRCTVVKMTDQGVYILENGIHMFIWIGLGANQNFIQQVFGVPSAVQVNIEQTCLPELNNPLSEAVRTMVEQIRSQRHRYMRLTLVRQKEKMESVFKHFLIEDRGLDGSPSYVDFLCHMHKEIRNILS